LRPSRRPLGASCLLPLLMLAVVLAACGEAPGASETEGSVILLLAGNTFAEGDRPARLLNEAAAATDILGTVRFEIISAPDAAPGRLPALLEGRGEVRAVIAILGDLSVLDGVDPSDPARVPDRLTSRRLPREELLGCLADLEQRSRILQATFVPATAPLGKQGRLEVPELLEVADMIRSRGPCLDLAAAFTDLEDAWLFTNGIDRLDAYGQDELVRAIFLALCEDPGPVPPRTQAERAARGEARALQHLVRGRLPEFLEAADRALVEPPWTPRHAARQAAITAASEGLAPAVERMRTVDVGTEPVPGLALIQRLIVLQSSALPPPDSFEAQLVAVLDQLGEGEPGAGEAASTLTDRYPQRIEAWLVLQLASLLGPRPRDVRSEARHCLQSFPRSAVDDTVAGLLLDGWPASVVSLPAVLLGSLPFESLKPTGPLLETARRRAALGHATSASRALRAGLEKNRFPPSWFDELDGLER
jgi:hypothetical protein